MTYASKTSAKSVPDARFKLTHYLTVGLLFFGRGVQAISSTSNSPTGSGFIWVMDCSRFY